jgi:clathrin heavy chain
VQVLCFKDGKPKQPPKLFVMEVGRDKSAPGGVFRVTPQNIPVPPDAPNDFPVTVDYLLKIINERYGAI